MTSRLIIEGVVEGQETEVGGGQGGVLHCPGERCDIEAGGCGCSGVEDGSGELESSVGWCSAPIDASASCVALVDRGAGDDLTLVVAKLTRAVRKEAGV